MIFLSKRKYTPLKKRKYKELIGGINLTKHLINPKKGIATKIKNTKALNFILKTTLLYFINIDYTSFNVVLLYLIFLTPKN
jgi:hypothetical protein